MPIYDLLFIALVLGTIITLVSIEIAAAKRNGMAAKNMAVRLGILWLAYLIIVAVVGASSSQTVIKQGDDKCYDEFCYAIVGVSKAATVEGASGPIRAQGVFCVVTLRLSNHGYTHPERENGVECVLVDDDGSTYHTSPTAQAAYDKLHPGNATFQSKIGPQSSELMTQVFDLPSAKNIAGLHLERQGPGSLIIGSEDSLLHKPTIFKLS